MARLNSSSEDTLNEYLNSIIDRQVLLELPLHGEGVNLCTGKLTSLLICYYKYNPCVLNLIKKRV